MDSGEGNGPEFRLIGDDAGDCTARYCFEKARHWAIWNRIMPLTRSALTIKKAVCHTHREATEGKPWDQISEDFRTFAA